MKTDNLTNHIKETAWTLWRNDIVKTGIWRGQQLLEYRHDHYGTVITWPATNTARFWVTSKASDDWNKKPHDILCGEMVHGPGDIIYSELTGLFAAIEAACTPPKGNK